MKQLGVKSNVRVHMTRLSCNIFWHSLVICRLREKGHDILMAFEEDIDSSLAKASEFDRDMSIFFYDCVLHISTQMGNSACEQY